MKKLQDHLHNKKLLCSLGWCKGTKKKAKKYSMTRKSSAVWCA